jgi:NhaP-type Na+/H+ or K+/H+ antiporter
MPLMAGIGGGLVLGALLGFVGLKLTRFVTTEEGHFYTPNTHIGIALSVLFAGRILYNYWIRSQPSVASDHPQMLQSPLTLFIFGLVAGYYLVYYIGLFVHTHDRKPDGSPPLPPVV